MEKSNSPETVKVLMISYKYNDRTIENNGLNNRIKTYYENNSRGKLIIDVTNISIKVPFDHDPTKTKPAIDYVNDKKPKGFDVYVHLCNPRTSHTGRGNVITYNSITNTIHEFGHALGLDHSNTLFNGVKKTSRDPFDQMTITSPYPSTNCVHRYLKGWYLENEFITVSSYPETITLGQMKNFYDRLTLKCLKKDNYFFSYNEKDGDYYLCVHSLYGPKSSFLIKMIKLSTGLKINFDSTDFVVEDFSKETIRLIKTPQ